MESKPTKLRVLCLYGMNNTIESFQLMTEPLRERYGNLIEFVYINGPILLDPEVYPPEAGFLKKGIKGPFRAWLQRYNADDLTTEEKAQIQRTLQPFGETPDDKGYMTGFDESLQTLIKAFREQGPFDGVLSFSQGSSMYRYFNWWTQVKKREEHRDIKLPRFHMMFAGTTYVNAMVKVDGVWYRHGDHPCQIETLHVYGKKDPFFGLCEAETLLFKPITVVVHQEGHKIPKEHTPDNQKIIDDFVASKNREKNERPKL
ncbi:hypothetical protein FGO68_gene8372 [Halteria grandinella]|uniref:Serine hydrolase domain-containing protein n=1 Tax=Halteria grandinella TaxID=5974 RepID=A0A8J8NK84_HALGN|nr:hypothetical protein FGO68_gene8372 [Halteria grandinella]